MYLTLRDTYFPVLGVIEPLLCPYEDFKPSFDHVEQLVMTLMPVGWYVELLFGAFCLYMDARHVGAVAQEGLWGQFTFVSSVTQMTLVHICMHHALAQRGHFKCGGQRIIVENHGQ